MTSAPQHLLNAQGLPNFGRYTQPIAEPSIAGLGRRARLRTKRWHYVALTTERHYVAVAVVDLGFAGHGFAYVVDRVTGAAHEYACVAGEQLLRPAAHMAPSSVSGVTRWRRGDAEIAITASAAGWTVTLDVPAGDQRLSGEAQVRRPPGSECLALVHRFGPKQPAYTHKEAGLPAVVDLRLGPTAITGDALASLDWTLGWLPRDTRWKWTSAAWHDPAGQRVGLNLSAHIYEDARGHGLENGLWVDGKLWPLDGVVYDVPQHPEREPWHVRSAVGDTVSLRFEPLGARSERLDVGVIASVFTQPYGTFSGHVHPAGGPQVALDGVFGVVEDHVSRW